MKIFIIPIVVLSLVMASGSPAQAVIFETNWSFDSVYSNIRDLSLNKNINEVSPIGEVAVNPIMVASAKKTVSKPKRIYFVSATGYSSTPDQTDDSPFITAAGTYVRDGIIASNFLPLGTAIKIPEIFGDKIFIVEDRMNRRYAERIDVWFPDRVMALQFGFKSRIRIEVI